MKLFSPTIRLHACIGLTQSTKWLTRLLLSLMLLPYGSVVQAQPKWLFETVTRTYADSQNPKLSKSGPVWKDPNIYIYTAEFAKRFLMPPEWISEELKGVDAVAWRMMPGLKQCGWGADPKDCRDTMKCEIDLYFDHMRHPLPWDPTRPERFTSFYLSSVRFIANLYGRDALNQSNYPIPMRELQPTGPWPPRPAVEHIKDDLPWLDPKTGSALSIQHIMASATHTQWGSDDLIAYDKELFTGISFVTMVDPGCSGQISGYVLSNQIQKLPMPNATTPPSVVYSISIPQAWRDKLQPIIQEQNEKDRQTIYYKSEITNPRFTPQAQAKEQKTDKPLSYADRQNPQNSSTGILEQDPHIYAYTAEFAKRFDLPPEWINEDLQGADAIAWRMLPSFKQCGWGGNPQACSSGNMHCEVDLYFDHQRHPLPWDTKRIGRKLDRTLSPYRSVFFIALGSMTHELTGIMHFPASYKKQISPKRLGDDNETEASPWIDIQTGRGLALNLMGERWRGGADLAHGYDKKIFSDMAFFTVSVIGCRNPTTFTLSKRPRKNENESVVHTVLSSKDWRNRVAESVKSYHEAQNSFLEGEGKKALKAIRGQASE